MIRPTIFIHKTKELLKKLTSSKKKEIVEIKPEEVKQDESDK